MTKDKSKNTFVANWKMNLTLEQSVGLAEDFLAKMDKDNKHPGVVICPSFPALPAVSEVLSSSSISLGAQDLAVQDRGALTGEVSPLDLKELGVEYVIIGHSERRHQLGETDVMVNQKLKSAFKNELFPIVCVGEEFTERQAGRADFVIAGQVESALKDIKLSDRYFYIAYEPVWAIGSGQTVKPEEAEQAARVIKQVIIDLYPDIDLKNSVSVLYGGSVKGDNAADFLSSGELSGVLVGGASLSADDFYEIINSV